MAYGKGWNVMEIGKLSGSQLQQRAERIETPKVNKSIGSDQLEKQMTDHKSNEKKEVSIEEAKKMVDSLNEFVEASKSELKFEFHEKLDEYFVKLVNPKTKETVREIPPKKLLDMYAAMAEFMGLLVDKKI